MKKILFAILLALSTYTYATGPSYLWEKIKPISVNKNGEILCRTKYIINEMGSRIISDVEYGVCVLTGDSIVKRQFYTLSYEDPEEYEEYATRANYWDSIYNSPLDLRNQSPAEKELCKKYGFTKSNVPKYERNDTLSIKDLRIKREIDLIKNPMYALNGGRSVIDPDEDSLNVVLSYDFGNILFFENDYIESEDEYCITFDYQNPTAQNTYFEMPYITGIYYRKKK